MRHHDNKHTFPLPPRAGRRARSGSRHGFCANSRRCAQLHTGLDSRARRRRCGTAHRISTTHRRQSSSPPAPRCSPAMGRRLGRILESRGGEIQEGELMNRGSLRPSAHARHRHRGPPCACHDASSSAASLGLHCAVTPFLPVSRPETLFCWPPPMLVRENWAVCFGVCEATWCGAPGDVPAGEMRGKPVLAFASHLLPTGRGGKQTTAQSANHHHVVGRAGGTVSGRRRRRRSVLRH